MPHPLASVIIPSRNRPQSVAACLDALAAQTMPPGSFEVIVVDDGSSTPLALDADRWSSRFPLVLINQSNAGPAGARNRGAAAARGEWLAFTDDDCLPTPTWLERLGGALALHPDAIVGGATFNGLPGDVFAETSQLIVELVYEHFNADPVAGYFFASNNVAVRRDRHLEIGGFDADFGFPGAEDREWCDRWRIHGRPLVWERRAVIEHRHAQRLGDFVRLHWRYGRGAFRYQRKRSSRGSGTMAEDVGFHRRMPGAVVGKLGRYPFIRRLAILRNLCIWQLANAAGFLHEWSVDRAVRGAHP